MLKNKKILVIDDDVDFCDFCKIVLSHQSANVVCAMTAKDGLVAACSECPDLIILDIMMEESDSGLKLANKLTEECKGVPILMVSSLVEAAAQVFDITSIPVSELREKPMRSDELVKIADRLIEKSSGSTCCCGK